jgi:hypothetical protein
MATARIGAAGESELHQAGAEHLEGEGKQVKL